MTSRIDAMVKPAKKNHQCGGASRAEAYASLAQDVWHFANQAGNVEKVYGHISQEAVVEKVIKCFKELDNRGQTLIAIEDAVRCKVGFFMSDKLLGQVCKLKGGKLQLLFSVILTLRPELSKTVDRVLKGMPEHL